MKTSMAIIAFLIASAAFSQDNNVHFTVRAEKNISIEFSKPNLAPWRWDTVIIHGLPAGAKGTAIFDRGAAWLMDSLCILIPYVSAPVRDSISVSFGNGNPDIRGFRMIRPPGFIDSGRFCFTFHSGTSDRLDSVVKVFCILPGSVTIDSFALNWGARHLEIADTNSLSKKDFLNLSGGEFTFYDGVHTGTFPYGSVEMIIETGGTSARYFYPGSKLSAEMIKAVKNEISPFSFSLILRLKRSHQSSRLGTPPNPALKVDFKVSE